MKQVFKATVILGGATMIATCVRVVNTKFIAIYLGPIGVGVFYQLVFFAQAMYMLTCFGTRMGVTKYLSELKSQQNYDAIRIIVRTCIVFLLILSFPVSLAVYIYAGVISRFLFDTSQYAHYIRFIALAIPIGTLMDFSQGILYGLRMVNRIALYNASESVFNAMALIPLIYFLGLKGAVTSIYTTYSIQLILLIIIIKRYSPVSISFNVFKWAQVNFRAISKVIRYGAVTLVITFSRELVLTILFRRFIILNLGIEANGIYSPAFGISYQLWLLVAFAVYAYSFSRISEAKDNAEIQMEVNNSVRTILLLMGPVIFILIGFRRQIVLLLYTAEFLPVTAVMPVQFIGDFFKLLVLSISLPIHARAHLKAMLFFEVGIYILFYFTAQSLISSMGLLGASWSYLILYLVYFIVVTPYVMKKFHFRLERKNVWIVVTSFLLLLTGCYLDLSFFRMVFVSIIILALWAGITLTRGEWKFGLEKSKEYIGKAGQYLKLS